MHIRVTRAVEAAVVALVDALEGADAREVFEAFDAVGDVGALVAIQVGAHKSASAMAGYALRVGVAHVAEAFKRAGVAIAEPVASPPKSTVA